MEIPASVEWSFHCAFLLAQLDGATVSGRRIAEFYDLPPAYLSKVLKAMVAGGVLHAGKGPQGGYRLARAATEITALDIVQSITGAHPAFRCTEIRQRGPVGLDPAQCLKPCAIAGVMYDAEKAWRQSLASVTLADVVDRAGVAGRRRAQRWLAEPAGRR